jgi:hypothetical protein
MAKAEHGSACNTAVHLRQKQYRLADFEAKEEHQISFNFRWATPLTAVQPDYADWIGNETEEEIKTEVLEAFSDVTLIDLIEEWDLKNYFNFNVEIVEVPTDNDLSDSKALAAIELVRVKDSDWLVDLKTTGSYQIHVKDTWGDDQPRKAPEMIAGLLSVSDPKNYQKFLDMFSIPDRQDLIDSVKDKKPSWGSFYEFENEIKPEIEVLGLLRREVSLYIPEGITPDLTKARSLTKSIDRVHSGAGSMERTLKDILDNKNS